jgi:hypothetical protein
LHDRDTKFCSVFRATLAAGGILWIPSECERDSGMIANGVPG